MNKLSLAMCLLLVGIISLDCVSALVSDPRMYMKSDRIPNPTATIKPFLPQFLPTAATVPSLNSQPSKSNTANSNRFFYPQPNWFFPKQMENDEEEDDVEEESAQWLLDNRPEQYYKRVGNSFHPPTWMPPQRYQSRPFSQRKLTTPKQHHQQPNALSYNFFKLMG